MEQHRPPRARACSDFGGVGQWQRPARGSGSLHGRPGWGNRLREKEDLEASTDKAIADNDTRAKDAEKVITDNFNAEKTRVSAKEATTDATILANDQRARDEEKAIKENIVAVNSANTLLDSKIEEEKGRAKDAEKVITDNFNAEKSRVATKEASTDKAITDNDTRAKDAEKVNTDNFNAEKKSCN